MSEVLKRRSAKSAAAVKKVLESDEGMLPLDIKPDFGFTISTGSTLLDLTISGDVILGGGIPAGILFEIYGPSGSGKTALIYELSTSAQNKGWNVNIKDPEGRMNEEYAKIYGVDWKIADLKRPGTIQKLFEEIKSKESEGKEQFFGIDSLAALCSEMEMDEPDKMGMARAKEFSAGLRRIAGMICENKWIVGCTNQIRHGLQMGRPVETTTGGNAVEFYSSLRIRTQMIHRIIKEKAFGPNKTKIKESVGIETVCTVKKSSIAKPDRSCIIYILYNYGIDDVRGNLQYRKDILGDTKYDCFDKSYVSLDDAIKFIEDNDLAKRLKRETTATWLDVQKLFVQHRKAKDRG